jgi:hypothetical protein
MHSNGNTMTDYEPMTTWTPGGHAVPVRVIDRKHTIFVSDSGVKYTVPCFDDSGVRYVTECIKETIRHRRNCPVLVTGDPGLGKSTVICLLAQEIDPSIGPDFIAFELDEFEEIFSKNPYGDAEAGVYPMVSMDEAGHTMYGPEYLELEQRILAKNLIISRIKKQIVFFAVPKWKYLNPHVRNLMTVWIHVSEPDYFLQGSATLKFPPPGRQSEYQTSKFWNPNCVFTFPPLKNKLWSDYEARKVDFVNSSWDADKDKVSVLRKIAANLSKKGMTQTEIAEIIERDRSRVSRYLGQRN